MNGPLVVTYGGHRPRVHPAARLAPTATLVGDVQVDAEASVFYGAVLRADMAPIRLGARSNVQDNCVLHTDTGFPTVVGAGVSIGHGAVVHGCTVEDDCLIGMHATVLNGARIGTGSLVAAGTVVLEGTVVPPRSLVAGLPGRVRRTLDEAELERITANADAYLTLSAGQGWPPPVSR